MREQPPRNLGCYYYRDLLSLQAQSFYDCMEARFARKNYDGTFHFKATESKTAMNDLGNAQRALRDDHPEFFFLGGRATLQQRRDEITIRNEIEYDPAIIERIRLQMRRQIFQIVRGTLGLSLQQQEKMVYERIVKRLTYINHRENQDHSVVGPVLYRSGVCEGYNALLLLCLRRLQIPCIKVFGKYKQEDAVWHCWTKAWLGEESVHCDVTWDGHAKDGRYRYFNLSEDRMRQDHLFARWNAAGQLRLCQ